MNRNQTPGTPKVLITKLLKETLKVALLMIKGIVTSLEIIDINQWMGNRGSKSDSNISVKEQRVDGFSISSRYCKVYSKCQGNLVFMHTIFNKKYFSSIYSTKNQISLFSSQIRSSKLNPYYVTGFSDGESCFFLGVKPSSRYKTKFRVKTIFLMGVHLRDSSLLEQIKLFFGVGQISNLGQDSVQYRISAIKDLKVIFNHFKEFPLLIYKQCNCQLLKVAVQLIKRKEHLILEGLNHIVSIKTSLNNKEISNKLIFPNWVSALKPEVKDRKIKSLYWLAGFLK